MGLRNGWTGAENLAPTWIRSLDRPARSESLYRLSYPVPVCRRIYLFNFHVINLFVFVVSTRRPISF